MEHNTIWYKKVHSNLLNETSLLGTKDLRKEKKVFTNEGQDITVYVNI